MADEPLQITYSYWDGAGHRRMLQVRKGDSIGEFLRAVQQQLATEFREVRTSAVENMIYIKEDLIIPHASLPLPTLPPGPGLIAVPLPVLWCLGAAIHVLRAHHQQGQGEEWAGKDCGSPRHCRICSPSSPLWGASCSTSTCTRTCAPLRTPP